MRKKIRILWLLNHTTLRRFEISQFQALGIDEFFLPKSFPYDEGNLSASIDKSYDSALTIPKDELEILNNQNWYASPSKEAWHIANQYFDIAVIGFFPQQISSSSKNFKGSIVLRVFGLAKGYSYTQILSDELGLTILNKLRVLGERFWFGAGYEHLKDEEGQLFKQRNCFLPVGLEGQFQPEMWNGGDRSVFFVCPRIETSPYFKSIYKRFIRDFSDFAYKIGGAQAIHVSDSNVLGFVPLKEHERNMREMRVMFYHSTEPNHIHYHPFEAIRAGMPLVFMAGGMLDRFGGKCLPGRCKNIKEAKQKIKRIMEDDWTLIDEIRNSQVCLLEPMMPENCSESWRSSFKRIIDSLEKSKAEPSRISKTKIRIAVIVPVGYRGGSLRGAKVLAQAIELGSQQAGEEVEVVFGHLDDPECYSEDEFSDLPSTIKLRSYKWKILDRNEAYRAMVYAGLERSMESAGYLVPEDNFKQFTDCDLWVIVSDRLEHPLLPMRPYVLMVYDYLQRYEKLLPHVINQLFISAAHSAERIIVTTEFTRADAIQFAGMPANKVSKLPMLAPLFTAKKPIQVDINDGGAFFLWTTNLASHKNHEKALEALKLYYEVYAGILECRVTGVGTKVLFKSDLEHLKKLKNIRKSSPILKRRLKLSGELSDQAYQAMLSDAQFLWHAGRIDNGTFSVIEAAQLGVPSLSSYYPAMREIDRQFSLNLQWMDAHDPDNMARQLKYMEQEAEILRTQLPSSETLAEQTVGKLAQAYWETIKECL